MSLRCGDMENEKRDVCLRSERNPFARIANEGGKDLNGSANADREVALKAVPNERRR